MKVEETIQTLAGAAPAGLFRVAPFDSDEAYWRLKYRDLKLRGCLFEVEQSLSSTTLRDGFKPARLSKLKTAIELEVLRCSATLRLRSSLTDAASDSAPRIMRVAKRLDLPSTDVDVLACIVYLMLEAPQSRFLVPNAGLVADYLGLEDVALLRILDDKSPLQKFALISTDRRIPGSPRSVDVRIEIPLVKALRGIPISAVDQFALPHLLRSALFDDDNPLNTEAVQPDEAQAGTNEQSCDALSSENLPPHTEEKLAPMDGIHSLLSCELEPYKTDVDYLNDHIRWFDARIKWNKLTSTDSSESYKNAQEIAGQVREAEIAERVARTTIDRRLDLTTQASSWKPRAEILAKARGLSEIEKHFLLFLAASAIRPEGSRFSRSVPEVGEILYLFFDSFEERIAGRRYFYRDAPLVRDGLVLLESRSVTADLSSFEARIDPRMVEHLLSLEMEGESLVDGSHLYRPHVELDRVVLDPSDKELILRTVESFPAFVEARRRFGLESTTSGGGIVLLFYGPSGTGKTMLANALATHLRKKVLLVNFPTLGSMHADETLRFLFREARVNDAMLFFDECEGIFKERNLNSNEMSLILTEMERHDGLVILATNRPLDLDEAMHRRITLAVEFPAPDSDRRQAIWKAHVGPEVTGREDIDFRMLATRYELTGGLIKNAVVAAVAEAVSANPSDPVVTQRMLEKGASLQLTNRIRSSVFEDRLVPKRDLSHLVLTGRMESALAGLINAAKARPTLVGEWGFDTEEGGAMGTTALFTGPPGTGKTLAAEVVALEVGKPLKVVNAARVISMWVGEGAKNLEKVFQDARQHDAVLLFDEADALFGGRTAVSSATDRYANLDTAILLREIERFPGIVILTTNLPENIDLAFRRRLRHVIEFSLPDEAARERLWRLHVPEKAPLSSDVCFGTLAREFVITGAQIRNAVVKAASRAASRSGLGRVISMEDLRREAEDEQKAGREARPMGFIGLASASGR